MERRGIKGTNNITIEGDIKDLNTDTPIDGYEYGASLQADPTPVIDPGTGKTVSLRVFEFTVDPNRRLYFPTNKQKIFDDHVHLIRTMLWADGLIPYEGAKPHVVIAKNNLSFKIIVPAEARSSTMFVEKPGSLNNMLASTASKRGTRRHSK